MVLSALKSIILAEDVQIRPLRSARIIEDKISWWYLNCITAKEIILMALNWYIAVTYVEKYDMMVSPDLQDSWSQFLFKLDFFFSQMK